MTVVIGERIAVAASGGTDNTSEIAALQQQLSAAQRSLSASQKGTQSDATLKEQVLLEAEIATIQAQIAQLRSAPSHQAVVVQQTSQSTTSPQASAPLSDPTLGGNIDTQA